MIESKLIRRGLSLKILDYGEEEPASGGRVRQVVNLRRGDPRRSRQADHASASATTSRRSPRRFRATRSASRPRTRTTCKPSSRPSRTRITPSRCSSSITAKLIGKDASTSWYDARRALEHDRAFHILTLGCSKNRVDSDGMDHLLRQRGHGAAARRRTTPDVVIVNTCGFLGAARDESVAVINEMLDRRQDGQVVIAAGCMPALGNYARRHPRRRRPRPDDAGVVPDRRRRRRSARRGAATGDRRLRGDADHLQPGPGRSLGLRQGRRRLRPQLRLLHHPEHQGRARSASDRCTSSRRSSTSSPAARRRSSSSPRTPSATAPTSA